MPLLVAFALLLSAADPGAPAPAPTSFCTRMAETLHMHPVTRPKARPMWETSILKGWRGVFIGGVVSLAAGLESDEPTLAEIMRIKDFCKAAPKGALCTLSGPALLQVGFGAQEKINLPILAGEQATVSVVNTALRCVDG